MRRYLSLRPARLARLLLVGTVILWGATFVLVKSVLDDASPLLFNFLRMALATLVLAGVNWKQLRTISWVQAKGGAIAGLFLAIGYEFQTLGLARTSPARSAFITGMVVIFVIEANTGVAGQLQGNGILHVHKNPILAVEVNSAAPIGRPV